MAWSRILRFVAQEDGQVYLGQPVDSKVDVGKAFAAGEQVKVNVIKGSVFDSNAEVSSEEKTIKELLCPLTRQQVSVIRCLGLNYKRHQEESGYPRPQEPLLFIKPRTSLCGPGHLIMPKAVEGQLDFETELAVIIGKDARDVPENEALNYVLGYASANDLSARKFQTANSQICFGKGFDNACPMGPVIVSARDIPDPQALDFEGRKDGKAQQADSTSDMIFNVAVTIAHCSQGTTLEQGSVILMGTPKGVGHFQKPVNYLTEGSKFEVEFSHGLGTLVNTFSFA